MRLLQHALQHNGVATCHQQMVHISLHCLSAAAVATWQYMRLCLDRSLRDTNVAKIEDPFRGIMRDFMKIIAHGRPTVATSVWQGDDLKIFMGLLADLFPGVEAEVLCAFTG